MKSLVLALALAPMMAFAAGKTTTATTTTTTTTAATTAAATTGTPVDVKITGMTCGSCVQKVQDELAKVQGVDKASLKVELKGNHATMTVAQNDEKMMTAIKDAVTKAGFKVEKIDVATAPTATKKN